MKTSTKIMIAVAVVLVIAVVGYYFWNKKKTVANLQMETRDPLTEIAQQ